MHSVAMPSLSLFQTNAFSITSPTPCYPFLPLTPLHSPQKKTRYTGATSSKVPSCLETCSPITSQPFAEQGLSRVSMWPMPLTPRTAAVRLLKVPNVSSSGRDLALAILYFMWAALFTARFPRRSVLGSCLCFSDVEGAAVPACLEFFIVDTFAYSHFYSLLAPGPTFSAAALCWAASFVFVSLFFCFFGDVVYSEYFRTITILSLYGE